MFRILLSLALGASLTLASAQERPLAPGVFFAPSPKDEKPKEVKVLGQTPGRMLSGNGVFKTEEEVKNAKGDLDKIAERTKVGKLDFTKHMVVVVGPGMKPTGGYQVEVLGTEIKDGVLIIKWKTTPPDGIATQAFTNPATTAVLDHFKGKIEFDPKLPELKKQLPKPSFDNLKPKADDNR